LTVVSAIASYLPFHFTVTVRLLQHSPAVARIEQCAVSATLASQPGRENAMARKANTTRAGGSFDNSMIRAVWNKGRVIDGYDPRIWRRDCCGRAIKLDQYGQTTEYGWEIDHIRPVAKQGTDDLSNLQPLYWETNRTKGDTYPWVCS
jgi:hypothetical protein